MSDEKQVPAEVPATTEAPAATEAAPATPVAEPVAAGRPVPRPTGWMYKGFKAGKRELWYASPIVQLLMVALVCFLCPGMFNALGGLGGAGQLNAQAQDDANTALYSTFAVVAFFSGSIANVIGVKLAMSFGGLGYCIYAASFLCYNHTKNIGVSNASARDARRRAMHTG